MAIELYYTTRKLEEQNQTGACPHCEKVASVTSLLDVNYAVSDECGEFLKCNNCKEVTFVHDNIDEIIEITEPVRVSWETFHSHLLDAPSLAEQSVEKEVEEKKDSDLPLQ